MESETTPPKNSKFRFSNKSKASLAVISIIIIAAVVSAELFKGHQKPEAIPASIIKQLNIALYYPTNLPSGWAVDKNSFKIPITNVLTYAVTDNKQNRYFISEQALPAGFDFTAFQKKFSSPDNFVVKAGSALVGPASSNLVGSIRTPDNSWLIINISNTDLQNQVETLARSLSPL